MPIKVSCKCGQSFAAKDQMAGKTVRCPKCKQPLKIPGPQASPSGPQARAKPAPAPQSVPASGGLDDLFDEIGLAPEQPTMGPRCPGCGKGLPPHALICVDCGFNLQTGQRVATSAPAPLPKKSGGGHGDGGQAEALVAKAAKEIEANPISSDATDFGEGTNPWAWVLTLFLPLLFILAVWSVLQWGGVIAAFLGLVLGGAIDGDGVILLFGLMALLCAVVTMICWFKITFTALEENVFFGLLCIILLGIFVPIYGFIRYKKLLGWAISYLVSGFMCTGSVVVLVVVLAAREALKQ